MLSRKKGLTTVALVLAAFSLLHLFLFIDHGLNVYDEGVAAYGALRLAQGDMPYRDFWTIYAPGQFYALAGVYGMFGFSLIVGRVFTALMLVGAVIAVFTLAARRGGRAVGALAMMLAAVWVSSFEGRTPAMPCSVLLSLVSCVALLAFAEARRGRDAVLAGVLTGLAVLYRHDIGVYTAIAQGVVLLAVEGAGPVRDRLRGVVAYAVGGFTVLGPALVCLLLVVPADVLLRDLVSFPARVYPAVRSLPYPAPGLQTMAFYFTPLMCAVCLARYRLRSARVLLFVLMGLLFMGQAAVRSDVTHLFPAMFPGILLFGFLTGDMRNAHAFRSGVWGGAARWVYLAMPALCAVTFLRPLTFQLVNVVGLARGGGSQVVLDRRGKSVRLPSDKEWYPDLVRYVRNMVPPEESIFVGNRRHDRIAVNDVVLYFLAERACATRYHELHPGMATTAACQRRIVQDLESAGVNTVVLGDFDNTEPNKGGESSGVRLLDEHIAANFVTVTNFGPYVVMERK